MAKSNTSTRRFFKLAGMTAQIATKTVGNSIKSFSGTDEQKEQAKTELLQDIGLQIANTLGQMKGAAMKVGQIASQYKDMLPPEIASAVAKLQKQAPPIPYEEIKTQIEKELNKPVEQLFQSIETEPFAAASIGQVHRAVLPTGEHVIVKVQYPGVDEACESDLKQVKLALKLTGLLKINRELQDRIFKEIQQALHEELNYELEAQNLAVFRTFHSKLDEKIIIPQVYSSHSSRRVLTLSQEMGEDLTQASTWDLDTRNQLGRRLFQAIGQQVFYLQRFHCDPHPGNFAFRKDGSVIIYDFGAIHNISADVLKHMVDILHAARSDDMSKMEQGLIALEVRKGDIEIPADFYRQWVEILLRPVTTDYDFEANSSHHDGIKLVKPSLKYWDSFQPSPETLMLNRTVSGHYWNLINLKIHTNFEQLMDSIVPKAGE